jgi:hypothetical protein
MSISLDTLAQLDHNKSKNSLQVNRVKGKKQIKNPLELSKEPFRKRARSKAFMDSIVYRLIDLDSPMKDAYWSTYHCTNVILQEGDTTRSKFCKQRWCKTCNNIRTANLMNGYREPLKTLNNPQFVTLTVPNIEGQRLKQTIEGMVKTFVTIKRSIERNEKTKVKGIRKIECTYNDTKDNYHPHFHLIIEGKENAEKIVSQWLKRYPKATRKAQDIKQAQEGTMQELFKYFTKLVTKETFYPKQMDIIFRAMKGKRVFQAFGIKKQVSEDIDNIEVQKTIHLGFENEIYVWDKYLMDWVSSDGVIVADYTPGKKYLKYLDKLKNVPL